MGTEASTTILGSAPPSKDTVATPSGRPEAKAATPLTHVAVDRSRWRRPGAKPCNFRSPRAPGLRQFTGMEQGHLLFGGGGRDVDFLGELVRHRVGKGIEILDDQQKGIGSADHILSIV